MTKIIAVLSALAMYLSSLISAIPVFIKTVKGNPDFSWTVEINEIEQKTKEEYYEFYQKYYTYDKDNEAYSHPERYQDMTDQYQALMDENLKMVREWKKVPGLGHYKMFAASLNNAMFDYKREAIHKPIIEKWGMEDSDYFVAYGVVISWEALGNFNFSFLAAAMGFTPVPMKTGGGLLNIMGDEAEWEMMENYFDHQEDADWIDFGIQLYSFIDSAYEEQAKQIDIFFALAEPRLILTVYKIYNDK